MCFLRKIYFIYIKYLYPFPLKIQMTDVICCWCFGKLLNTQDWGMGEWMDELYVHINDWVNEWLTAWLNEWMNIVKFKILGRTGKCLFFNILNILTIYNFYYFYWLLDFIIYINKVWCLYLYNWLYKSRNFLWIFIIFNKMYNYNMK